MGRPILLGSVPSVIITIPCPPVRSRLPWAWVARARVGCATASRVSAAMVSLPRVLPRAVRAPPPRLRNDHPSDPRARRHPRRRPARLRQLSEAPLGDDIAGGDLSTAPPRWTS